jgi:hypothetical protein
MPHARYFIHNSIVSTDKFFWDATSSPLPQIAGYYNPAQLDYGNIDVGLRRIVALLNSAGSGIETISCCEGHPDRDELGVISPEIWLRVHDESALPKLFTWITAARALRRELSTTYTEEPLIYLDYVDKTVYGYYFVLHTTFVSTIENGRILKALEATWPNYFGM